MKEESLKVLKEYSSKNGFKLTPQRVEIFHHLYSCNDHPTVEELHKRVKAQFPYVSLETVYRTIQKLESLGLVNKIYTVTNQWRLDADTTPHQHMFCKQCDSIVNIYLDHSSFSFLIDKKYDWGRLESINMVATGICQDCLQHNGHRQLIHANP